MLEKAQSLAFTGSLNGLIGPVLLLAPIALFALPSPAGRRTLALSAVLAVPWFLNGGARFLMPALPFLFFALGLALSRPAGWVVLVLHAALSWPAIIGLYAPLTWRLHGIPWQAALRLEPEADYLKRVSLEYRVAKMVEANTTERYGIFDLAGLQRAQLDRRIQGSWQNSTGEKLTSAFETAMRSDGPFLEELAAEFPERPMGKFRVEGERGNCIHEIELIPRYGSPIEAAPGSLKPRSIHGMRKRCSTATSRPGGAEAGNSRSGSIRRKR